jgi:mono/diheme cytochrome c family protein
MANDWLTDDEGNYLIKDGDFVIGPSEQQEVAEILEGHPGEWKEDPIIGAALTQMIKSKYDPARMRAVIKKQLARDGKDYEDYKDYINLKINNS